MFVKTTWYLLNIFFCIYNLSNLIQNKFKTRFEYEKEGQYLKEDNLSICLRIESVSLKCKEIIDKKTVIDACLDLKKLFDYIEANHITKSPYDILDRANNLNLASYFEFQSIKEVKVSIL